jgi:hypothetical protein
MYYQGNTYNGYSVTGLYSTYTDDINKVAAIIAALDENARLTVYRLTQDDYENAVASCTMLDDE